MSGEKDAPKKSDEAEKSNSDTVEKGDQTLKDDKPKEPEVPHGSLTEAKALYGKKDSDGKYQWETEEPVDAVDAAENEKTARYAFLVRKQISYDSRKKYDIHSVIVQSPWLKKALGVVLEDYPGITTNLDRLVFRAPFHPFVHRWTRLADMLEKNEFEEEFQREHLQLFHDVLFEELKNAIAAKTDLVKNGVITFEYLWTIFEPQTLVYSVSGGKECVFKLNSSKTLTDQRRGLDFLQLDTWSVDWDGVKFGQHMTYLQDYEFTGTTPITSLHAYPLEFHPEKEQLMARLLHRGKLFESFAGYHYKAYRGVALGYGRCGMIRHNIESRIIIDCEAHNRFLPNNAVYFSPLISRTRKAPRVAAVSDDDAEENENDQYEDAIDLFVDDFDYLGVPDTEDDGTKPERRPLTTEELLLAVSYVRGYAIKTKKWLWFYVDQVEEIKFAENAFASLVLPKEQKSLIRAFVESQVKYKDDFDDVIAGKGRGMIMLLAGPPGVGKTLTSESVAEDMRVPLYVMSAGDLGIDPSGIEESLNLVLDMVSKWNAVLLLDEADVFLEARSSNDLERNKMVSIFLRVLEYYEGVLFLTTNRVKNIDEAFHSRIHVTVNYPSLSTESRRHIWQTFLGHDHPIGSKDLDRLAKVNLNGRQIKNILKTSQMLARSQDNQAPVPAKDGKRGPVRVEMRHLETILAIERGTSWE
ncbi:hypothetical protein A1O7_09731 [Cladophialophora yegresii CBS 114405]|uniref:AAA+ ATPase domain-containing protein n=1 Tax=Cladophialophora yegresii CBS 114405 TaxID=1182544 RepID=W9VFL3_9EURO|nr:uncharacterized protein A1O7_09731 [Cladophialophora yegresii CBS 114405]EXJ54392.1 hypothetical protein A1O7_09731 [Cladophialophora yegresii CBS 114405]